MRTLIVVPDIFRSEGGIARIMRLYLKALCEGAGPDDEVDYIALNDRPEDAIRADAYSAMALRERRSCNCSKLRFTLGILRHGFSADRVICGHLHHLVVVWFLSWLRPGLHYYLVAHGIEVWRPYSLFEKWAMRRAHHILCISEYTRRQLQRFGPDLDKERLVIVPNTFDPKFSAPPENWGVRRPGISPRIIVVSRLSWADAYKGIDTMIEAMPRILQQFPQAQLRIVGGGDDRSRLGVISARLGLGSVVHFTGSIGDDQLRQEYAMCDIFALPSRKEGFGLVYLEAMTYGKPCIAARAGGAPEVVTDEVGALVEYGNTDQIALAVADLVKHPRDQAAMLNRAKAYSFPNFTNRLRSSLGDSDDRQAHQNILVFRLGFLGDTLVAVPALWAVREYFKDARIDYLSELSTSPWHVPPSDILPARGLIDRFVTYPGGRMSSSLQTFFGLWFIITRKKYDAVVYLPPRNRKAYRIQRDLTFFRLVGIKYIYGIRSPEGAQMPARDFSAPIERESDFLLTSLARSGIAPRDRSTSAKSDIGLTPVELDAAKVWLLSQGVGDWHRSRLIAVGPGSKMPAKLWPLRNYSKVVTHLIEKHDVWPIVFGGREDVAAAEELIGTWGRGTIAAGVLRVRPAAALLSKCLLYIGNDTGTMHLAASTGTRCVVPFSARDLPGRWEPFGRGHRVFRARIVCEGCMLEVCDKGNECLRMVAVSPVVEACEQVLSEVFTETQSTNSLSEKNE